MMLSYLAASQNVAPMSGTEGLGLGEQQGCSWFVERRKHPALPPASGTLAQAVWLFQQRADHRTRAAPKEEEQTP
jgi:hypothetical protein